MSRFVLVLGSVVLAACESVIGLGDLEFDRGGGGSTASGPTGPATSSGSTTSSSEATSATSTSATTTGDGTGGSGGEGGYGGYGGYGGAGPTTYADVVREDVPVAYWRLGELQAELLAQDDGGLHPGIYFNGDGGEYTLEQPGAITGDSNTAAAFQGGAHMLVDDAAPFRFPGKSPLTIELWMKFDSGGAAEHNPIDCQGGDPSAGWILYVGPSSFYWKRYGTDAGGLPASQGSQSSTVQNDGVDFHHVVLTMDEEGLMTHYVDGTISVLEEATPIDITDHDAPLVLGLQRFNPDSPLIVLDEVAIYDRQLPPERVSRHFQCGRFGNCD